MIVLDQPSLIKFIFDYYNQALFQPPLEYYLFDTKKRGVMGFVSPESIGEQEMPSRGNSVNHLNMKWESMEFHVHFVHHMLHIWQRDHGKPSRNGYHNKELATKAVGLGLVPSSTGMQEGRRCFITLPLAGNFIKHTEISRQAALSTIRTLLWKI